MDAQLVLGYYDDKCLNEELLKAGLAWHFRRYSKDEKLQALEDEAKLEPMIIVNEAI